MQNVVASLGWANHSQNLKHQDPLFEPEDSESLMLLMVTVGAYIGFKYSYRKFISKSILLEAACCLLGQWYRSGLVQIYIWFRFGLVLI